MRHLKPVAIIGGGITGLTAAFQLRQRGIPAVLYEVGDRVGGPIQTVRNGGYLAECGPNTILEVSPEISHLVRDLGLEKRRLYSDPRASNRYLVRNGRAVALPGSPGGFISTPLFSKKAKLRLLLEPFIRRSPSIYEESIAEFVIRRLGQEFLDYAINPLVAGIYAGDPARLSVKHAFPKLHALEQRHGSLIAGQIFGARERKRSRNRSKQNAPKFSFDEGLDVLTRTLHEKLQDGVRLGDRVTLLSRASWGWHLEGERAEGPFKREHSAVVMTIPAHEVSRLRFTGIEMPCLAGLGEIDYPPVASVVLGFRREEVRHPLNGFGILVPEVEGMKILGTIFSSSLFPGRAPSGHVTLTAYIGGNRAPALALETKEQLVAHTLADLRTLVGAVGIPTFEHVSIFRKAIPQYNVGYGRFLDLMTRAETAAPGLFIGGNSRGGISIGDSITSGCNLADRVALHCSQFLNQ